MCTEINDSYQALMEAGLSLKDIKQKIKAKAEEYQGYLSEEAVLFLIAKEYNLKVGEVRNQSKGHQQSTQPRPQRLP